MKGRGIFRNWRLLSAAFFAMALIGGAYWLAYGADVPQTAEASTQTALLKEIATHDSTGDGLPDWQKALYGIPLNATTTDYFHLGMTDGEAVAQGLIVPKATANIPTATSTDSTSVGAGTLTASFAQYFFSLYLNAKQANGGADLTADQTNALADQAMTELTQSSPLDGNLKTGADVHVAGAGTEAMRAYAIEAEAVFAKYQSNATTTEIDDLQSAVENNDATAVARLASAAQIYKNYANGLLALTVPQELKADHLALINSLILRSTVDIDLSHVNTDPLAALTALTKFSDTESTFWNVFSDVAKSYAAAGIVLPNGTPGANFVNVLANAKQQ